MFYFCLIQIVNECICKHLDISKTAFKLNTYTNILQCRLYFVN